MKGQKEDKRLMNEVKRYSVPCPNYLHTTTSLQEESSQIQVKILTYRLQCQSEKKIQKSYWQKQEYVTNLTVFNYSFKFIHNTLMNKCL